MAKREGERRGLGAAPMVQDLFERSWWTLAFRGLLGVVIGIVAIAWPACAPPGRDGAGGPTSFKDWSA
jgi:hypothetical protein